MKLKHIQQWLLWDLIEGRKVPINESGQMSGSNRVGDYMHYLQAVNAEDDIGTVMGTAFVFTADDDFCGIDLDDCLEADRSPKGWARPILERFAGTYIEVSPGLRGVKIYCEAKKPPGAPSVTRCRDGMIEVYDTGRFFCFTAIQYKPWSGDDVVDKQDAVDWLYRNYYQTSSLHIDVPEPAPVVGTLRIRAAKYVEACELAEEGGRNNAVFKLAGNLAALDDGGERLSQHEVYEFCRTYNSALSNPLPDGEVMSCVKSAWRGRESRPVKPNQREGTQEAICEHLDKCDSPVAPASESASDAATGGQKLFRHLWDSAGDWLDAWEHQEKPVLWNCGLPGVDMGPGMLVVIGGGPGSGKTTLACQLVYDAMSMSPGLRTLMVSVEVPEREVFTRLLAQSTGIEYQAVRSQEVTSHQEDVLLRHAREIRQTLGHRWAFLERPYHMQQVIAACREFTPDVVLLDYLQRIPPSLHVAKTDKREQIDEVMSLARAICDAGCCVVAISSLARPDKRKEGYDSPGLAYFRGSSELEYGADEAWGLTRDAKDTSALTLHHLKARYREPETLHLVQSSSLRIERVGLQRYEELCDGGWNPNDDE